MRRMQLSIVIVNYDTSSMLRESLGSVLRESSGLDAECIVVDNHSPDGSARMVATEFPGVQLIANSVNVGFSTGVNQGLARARGEYVLVLNADTLMLAGSIRALVDFMDDHPDCGIAGPRLQYGDGRLQPSCRTFYSFKTLLLRRTALGRLLPDHPEARRHMMLDWNHGSVRKVDWVLGAAMMVRRRALEHVGPMDERYFLYLEDVDWCYRMKQAGWAVYFCPYSRVVHYYRQGSRDAGLFNPDLWIHLESAVRYYDKWGELAYLLKCYLAPMRLPAYVLLDAVLLVWAIWGWTDPPWSMAPIGIVLLTAGWLGHYRLRGGEGVAELVWRALMNVSLGLLASGLFFWMTRVPLPHLFRSRLALVQALPSGALTLALTRWLVLKLRRWLTRRRLTLRRCVIVGTDQTARQLADALSADPSLGYDVAGFVGTGAGAAPLLGRPDELPALAGAVRAQEVLFVQGGAGIEALMGPVVACRRLPLDVKIVLSSPEAYLFSANVVDLCDFTAVDLPGTPLDELSRALKRGFDLFVAVGALLLLSPLLAAIALAIRKADGGPALEELEHIGAGERPFRLLRFRTSPAGASTSAASEESPAGTPFQAFLRRHKLDKLPELFNVLTGEMSLVGPRPPLAEEVAGYRDWHHSRFVERPGITGLWQVEKLRKWRFDQMVRLDLYYVLNRSLALDLQILLKTLVMVLAG
ncbi:MAG: sugar transferase [Candidatus Wallbacteria bacterium]|nr:sugar transferase [Candidatus Wallbacteria bacterium]